VYKYIHLNQDGPIATIEIDRQDALNALNGDVFADLSDVLDVVSRESSLRALIITGAGRAFVAGADIAGMSVLDAAEGRTWGQLGASICRRIEKLEIPVIAAVNGFALGGGCELALSCDVIIASEKAKFGQPEVTLGIIPGFSGTQRLPRRIGIGKAKELIYTGDIISAEEAERIGLVDKLVPPDALMDEAKALAEKIAARAPIAVKYAKAAINRGLQVDIDSGIAMENEFFALCFATEDQKNGMKAFLAKEQVEFAGK
jgi:enoyl-CoA hydratase